MNFQNLDFDYVEHQHPKLEIQAQDESMLMATATTLGSHPPPYVPRTFGNQSLESVPHHDEDESHIGNSSHDIPIGYAFSAPRSASPQATNAVPQPPSSPSPADSESAELYGPDQLFGRRPIEQGSSRPVVIEGPGFQLPELPPYPMSRQPAWETAFNASMLTGFRDDLVREAGNVTPGVDDTPFIHYALDAITRDRDTGYAGNATPVTDDGELTPRYLPGQAIPPSLDIPMQQQLQQQQGAQRQTQWPVSARHESDLSPLDQYRQPLEQQPQTPPAHSPQVHHAPAPVSANMPPEERPYLAFSHFRLDGDPIPSSPKPAPQPASRMRADSTPKTKPWTNTKGPIEPEQWRPLTDDEVASLGLPPLSYRPRLLRRSSFLTLTISCLLMIAALIFCAVYSFVRDTGLTPYVNTSGGLYFTFRILPQMLAAVILIYAQCTITTVLRIIPFVRLASVDTDDRKGAIFERLYPRSFIWPQATKGLQWGIKGPIWVVWAMNLTIPLQSSVFTVIFKDGIWHWSAVKGVAWTLVAFYVLLLAAIITVWSYWARTTNTGLLWDPRSLADIIAMISRTNTAKFFVDSKKASTTKSFEFSLKRRADDRLTYWAKKTGGSEHWYVMGNTMDDANFVPVPGAQAKGMGLEREKQGLMGDDGGLERDLEKGQSGEVESSYLPRCLRTGPLWFFIVAAFILLLVLIIISSIPATRISGGFPPNLSAAPDDGAFSAADFLFSFLPALLGMVLYLLFQSFEQWIRILAPWAAFRKVGGAPAEQSILADYAACSLPLHAAYHALRNRHWRVAALSALSTLFILIPILAGGMFMALTLPSGQVRIFPNIPAYAIVLALLGFYFFALCAALPGREEMKLPHAAISIAQIIGLIINDELRADDIFKDCFERDEMIRRIKASHTKWRYGRPTEMKWEDVDGVRPVRKFTVRKSQVRRDQNEPVRSSL